MTTNEIDKLIDSKLNIMLDGLRGSLGYEVARGNQRIGLIDVKHNQKLSSISLEDMTLEQLLSIKITCWKSSRRIESKGNEIKIYIRRMNKLKEKIKDKSLVEYIFEIENKMYKLKQKVHDLSLDAKKELYSAELYLKDLMKTTEED